MKDGVWVGMKDGTGVGIEDVGFNVGVKVGIEVGIWDGADVGVLVGWLTIDITALIPSIEINVFILSRPLVSPPMAELYWIFCVRSFEKDPLIITPFIISDNWSTVSKRRRPDPTGK